MNRNALCRCGSGRRYEECCGRNGGAPVPARLRAFAAQQAGSLGLAEHLYRQALAESPADDGALHMLGVVLAQRMRYGEALDCLLQAAERTDWAVPHLRSNLGRVLARLLADEAGNRQVDLQAEFAAWKRSRKRKDAAAMPLVTVVLRASGDAKHLGPTVASVVAQTYRPIIELIVVVDGSMTEVQAAAATGLRAASLPIRFLHCNGRNAPAALNEAAAGARGRYLAFIDAGDRYAPDRIATLVDAIARHADRWGFSLVSAIDAEQETRQGWSPADEEGGAAAGAKAEASAEVHAPVLHALQGADSDSFAFATFNVVTSPGNLFVERSLFDELGGFRDFPSRFDWDWCLRAAALAEPVIVPRPLYFHRVHGTDRTSERQDHIEVQDRDKREREVRGPLDRESGEVLERFLADALAGVAPCRNPLAPQSPANRALLLTRIMRVGLAEYLPVAALRGLAQALQSSVVPSPPPAWSAPAGATAIVVLGMHRSGTSALSRVLGLCGAQLPRRILGPHREVNPQGFWESEEIVNLDDRVLQQLGGAWNRIDFAIPAGGAVVDDFAADARWLLASEYGDARTIVIKDPRICLLAPLWDRALQLAGYRPVYVVPVRDPREVARSLHARGDMSVDDGLALWAAYAQRIDEFTNTVSAVVHLRFVDLLSDWRTAVRRIAGRLSLDLDADAQPGEVDRFLQPGLRRQRSDGDPSREFSADALRIDLDARYRRWLAHCSDAT
jgi:Glycosyl transferase family 2/SEC-C motif